MEATKERVRQQLHVKFFNDGNPEHMAALEEKVKRWKRKAPQLPEIPFKWFEAFEGWGYLFRFGRPAAMGVMPLSFETVIKYVERLEIAKRHQLILADQIITIDLEFVKTVQSK